MEPVCLQNVRMLPGLIGLILTMAESELPLDRKTELIQYQAKSNEVEAWWLLSAHHEEEKLPQLGLGIAQLLRSAEQLVNEFSGPPQEVTNAPDPILKRETPQ